MSKIQPKIASIQAKLPRIAALSGDKKTIATQEVKQAWTAGIITKAERDLLTRSIADSTNNVDAVNSRLNRYTEAFGKVDKNSDGKISAAEKKAAVDAEVGWGRFAGTPDVNMTPEIRAQLDSFSDKMVKTTVRTNDGRSVQRAEHNIGSLVDKLSKVSKE